MPAKIEKWIENAAMEIAAYINREGGGSADGIVEIIAAHAPKETGIKPDTAQADAVISELEAELLKFKQAFGEALLEIAGLKAREKP